jgi:hypothetical protein
MALGSFYANVVRSGLKTPSEAQWLFCPAKRDLRQFYYIKVYHKPPINAHILMYAALSRLTCALPLNLI